MTDTPPPSDSGSQRERLLHVPVAELHLAPHAPKITQAPEALSTSVSTYGILQPLLVRPGADGYEVVAGFKRLEAAKATGLTEVPVRVYRVEDEALEGLLEASNVRAEAPAARKRVQVPPSGEYKPSGKLGGLLEEELNRAPNDIPYKSIMTVAGIVILIIWAGIAIKKRLPERGERNPPSSATATPYAVDNDTPLPPDRDGDNSSPNRISVARWQLLLSEVDGVEVREEAAGIARIVFDEPVFSRLTTIDPNQKPRLEKILSVVRGANSSAVLTVIGHTDNDPIRPSSQYRSNEYLSELRAKEVVDFLKSTGIFPGAQLRPVAMGAEEPPFPNSSAESKAKNRTVTIEIAQPLS